MQSLQNITRVAIIFTSALLDSAAACVSGNFTKNGVQMPVKFRTFRNEFDRADRSGGVDVLKEVELGVAYHLVLSKGIS